jgi:hypothetical protein
MVVVVVARLDGRTRPGQARTGVCLYFERRMSKAGWYSLLRRAACLRLMLDPYRPGVAA